MNQWTGAARFQGEKVPRARPEACQKSIDRMGCAAEMECVRIESEASPVCGRPAFAQSARTRT